MLVRVPTMMSEVETPEVEIPIESGVYKVDYRLV
jgi:hypothetical protein